MVGSSPLLVLAFCVACIFGQLFELAQAQNRTQAATDPAEGISAPSNQWNISGEPCNGAAIDSTDFKDGNFNPLIKCDCSANSNSTCHITQLKVYALDVVVEFWLQCIIRDSSKGTWKSYKFNLIGFWDKQLHRFLPSELGNLLGQADFGNGSSKASIIYLDNYIDSSGVSGEIPSIFANLKSLQTMWASDTRLTGRIPDFIGNWSELTTLGLKETLLKVQYPQHFQFDISIRL
ncbi:putative lrr receptor-like serine/threonine-protein kinase, partial [Quercus suber]